jgi:hypothetical protein
MSKDIKSSHPTVWQPQDKLVLALLKDDSVIDKNTWLAIRAQATRN